MNNKKRFYNDLKRTGLLNDERMFKGCNVNDNFKFTLDNLKNFTSDKKHAPIRVI